MLVCTEMEATQISNIIINNSKKFWKGQDLARIWSESRHKSDEVQIDFARIWSSILEFESHVSHAACYMSRMLNLSILLPNGPIIGFASAAYLRQYRLPQMTRYSLLYFFIIRLNSHKSISWKRLCGSLFYLLARVISSTKISKSRHDSSGRLSPTCPQRVVITVSNSAWDCAIL